MRWSRLSESAAPTWQALAEGLDEVAPAFDPATADGLPAPARRWLTHAIPAGAPLRTTIELAMRGRIRLGPRWLPFTATQILRAGVGFVWKPVVGGPLFVGADILGPDDGRMEFRWQGLVPVARASGADTARSAAGPVSLLRAGTRPPTPPSTSPSAATSPPKRSPPKGFGSPEPAWSAGITAAPGGPMANSSSSPSPTLLPRAAPDCHT